MTEATTRLNVEINSKPAKSGADEVINQFKRMQQFSKGMWGTFADASKTSYQSANTYIKKLKSDFESLGKTVATIGRGIKSAFSFTSTVISSLGIYGLLKSLTDVGLATSKFTNLLTISVGSVKAAAQELSNLKTLANDLGLVYRDSVIPYAKFFAASIRSIDPNDIRDIFKAFGEATVALQLNRQEIQGVFLALQQMSSKGKVSMEELRLQLAERIPGAMQLAADAMGVTIQELEDNVRKGLVSAAELLPKFAQEMHETFGAAAELASKSVIGAFARLDNAIFEFMSNLANGGYMDALAQASDQIATWLNGNTEAAVALGVEIGDIAQSVANYITSIQPEDIANAFDSLKTTLGTIHQIFINLGQTSFVKWLVGDIRPESVQMLERLKATAKELKHDINWEKANIYGADQDEIARLNEDLKTVNHSIATLEAAMNRTSGSAKAMTIEINRSATASLQAEAAQQRLRLAIAAANDDIRIKSELLDQTAAQELATIQQELSYYRDRLDHYEEYNLNLSDVTVTKTKILGLLEKEADLLEDVAKAAAKAEKEYDAMAKAAIDAIEKENEFIFKESDRLLNLAAQYGSVEAQTILYNNELDKIITALRAVGATETEIAEATRKLWDEGPGKAAAEAAKEAKKEWEKTADSINNSLTDALLRGFEDGKSFAQNFRDTLENMFKTLILRPVVQAIVQPVANNIASSVTGFLGGGSSGGGAADVLGLAGSANSLFGGSSILGGVSDFLFGSQIVGAPTAAAAAAGATGLGTTGGVFGSLSGGAASAISGVASAIPYIGLALGAISLISGLLEDIPDPKLHGSGTIGNIGLDSVQDMSEAQAQRLVDTINVFEESFVAMLTDAEQEAIKEFEPPSILLSGHDDAGARHMMAASMIQRMTKTFREVDNNIANVLREKTVEIMDSDREFTMDDVEMLVQEVLAPILAVRAAIDEHFGGLDSISNIAETAENIIEAAGSLEQYASGLSVYLDAFFSESEKLEKATDILTDTLSELGLNAIPSTRMAFRELIEDLDLTTEADQVLHGALIALVPQLDAYYTALESTGVIVEDVTGSVDQLNSKLTDLMTSVEDEYAKLTMSDFMLELRDIDKWLRETTASAEEYGASTEQLALIQEVAAIRVKNAIASLQSTIDSLISQLYGGQTDALAAVNDQISIELSLIAERNSAAQDLYRIELSRYQESARLVDAIGDHLASLAQGSLSPLTPLEKYQAAQSEYATTLASAMGGDSDALNDIVNRRTALLEASQFYNASSTPYIADYNRSEADLIALANQLGLVTEPAEPGQDTTSAILRALEIERQRLLAEEEAENRRAMALELASHIGELGLAMDTSVWDLLAANGISIQQLADDIGINISSLDQALVDNLMDLSGALHVDFLDLASKLGVDIVGLAQQFGFDMDALGTNLDNWLVRAAHNIGSDVLDLATTLGVDIDHLGDLFAQELGLRINPLGADIKNQLAPYLTDIEDASNTVQMENALNALNNIVSGLPEAERVKLQPYLSSIISETGGANAGIGGPNPTVRTQLSNINSGISQIQQRTRYGYDIDETAFRSYMNIRQLVALNGGAPSYNTGTSFVAKDMMANIHQREMVIDARSADVLRKYGINVTASNDRFNNEVVKELQNLREEVIELKKQKDSHHEDDMIQRDIVSKHNTDAIDRSSRNKTFVSNTRKVL